MEQLEKLGTEVLHGAIKVIPPHSINQDVETREELEKWFREEVLGGRDDLTYKLELLSIVDLRQVFGEDLADEDDSFEMNTIDELFETDPVILTNELVSILARDNRISMKEELQENIALLAVPYASEQEMKELIRHQPAIQNKLGGINQISNTDEKYIEKQLQNHDTDSAREISVGIKEEAKTLNDILNWLYLFTIIS